MGGGGGGGGGREWTVSCWFCLGSISGHTPCLGLCDVLVRNGNLQVSDWPFSHRAIKDWRGHCDADRVVNQVGEKSIGMLQLRSPLKITSE